MATDTLIDLDRLAMAAEGGRERKPDSIIGFVYQATPRSAHYCAALALPLAFSFPDLIQTLAAYRAEFGLSLCQEAL